MSKNKFRLPTAYCERCTYSWTPRRNDPEMCPRCKSAYWNKPREDRKKKEEAVIN